MPTRQALLAFDTDRIKEYVFASASLRDIRGASAILDDLNRNQMARLVSEAAPDATTVYANGGSGLFVLASEHAQAARRAVERQYIEETVSASVSSSIVELPEGASTVQDVHDAWRQLSHRLRAAKDRNPAALELSSHAFLRPCDVCGTRYGEDLWRGPDGDLRICGSCARKREWDDRIRTLDVPRWASDPPADAQASDPLWRRLIASLRATSYPLVEDISRPEDFDTLAATSRPRGYMGLIYADGNGIGRELEQLRTLKEIGGFAQAVDQASYDTVFQTIVDHLSPVSRAGRSLFPFDILLLGGDDIVLVTSAHQALDVAVDLIEGFTRQTEARLSRPLGLSASVVIAHARYPLAALLKLAEGGLAAAKREASDRRRKGTLGREGLINFMVVNSTNHLNFDQYVERTLQTRPPQSAVALDRTLRPYATADFRRLLQAARTLAKGPRNRLQQLREACFSDYAGGRLDALSALLRWNSSASKFEAVRLVHELARATGGGEVQFPWFRDGERAIWRTPLVDLVEILDFVAGGNDASAP